MSGIGIGIITTVQTVYLTEISPGLKKTVNFLINFFITLSLFVLLFVHLVKYRGFMGTLTGFATSIGFVVASGIGLPHILGSALLWHWAYIIGKFLFKLINTAKNLML